MPLKTTSTYIKVCDLCGKEEGKHLESSDFFNKPKSINIKDYNGKMVTFELNIDLADPVSDIKLDTTLVDVINSYNSQKVAPESLIAMNMKKPFEDTTILCKRCYDAIVDIIVKNGKFDKPETF